LLVLCCIRLILNDFSTTQIQRMGGMSSAVIGGFCKHSPVVHELVAKFAGMAAKGTAKGYGRQPKEATAHQRHRVRQRLATGAWRDFHESAPP
jgi:hypothetical protein